MLKEVMMMLMPCRDGQIVEARKLKLSKYSRFYQNVNNIFSSTTPQGKPRLNENEITLCISLSLQFTYIRTCSYSHHLCNVKWWVVKIINQVHLHPMNWMELVSHAPRIESNRISQPRPSHRIASQSDRSELLRMKRKSWINGCGGHCVRFAAV